MIIEIVSTGTEILLGQIVNTTAPYLAKKLNELGFNTYYLSSVGDNRERMTKVIQNALSRADIVIVTGGLGPTLGDISKEVTAGILQKRMIPHEPSVEKIKKFFELRNMKMPESNLRQAMMPENSIVIDNDSGTAPGVIIRHEAKTIVHLPGPPHELEQMFEKSIIPFFKQQFGEQGIILSRILKVYGLGESSLEEKIYDFVQKQSNPTIALLARSGEIHLRLTAKGANLSEVRGSIEKLESQIRERIGKYIVSTDDETIEEVVGKALRDKKLTIALAESCTGGLVSSRLTDVPGSSGYLTGSIICYSNQIKVSEIGIQEKIILEHGAVSELTAVNMAANIRHKFNTAIGMGITGIAGPDGGSREKPVGLVYIAIDGPEGLQCQKYNFTGNRCTIKNRTAQTALFLLQQYISSVDNANKCL